MKVKIYANSILEAEKILEKALKSKKECSPGEQYCDPAINEFYEHIEARHQKLVESILQEVEVEIQRHIHSKGHI